MDDLDERFINRRMQTSPTPVADGARIASKPSRLDASPMAWVTATSSL